MFILPFTLKVAITLKISNKLLAKISLIIMSHSLLWRPIVLLTVGIYLSNHGVLYTTSIRMTRRCQTSC